MDYSSQPGDQSSQQSSYAPPPPPPPPQKRGFNWLACCGISCVVVLLVGGLIGFGCYQTVFKPIMAMGQQMDKVGTEVSTTDQATIRGAAVVVSPADLAANPDSYEGQWLSLTGSIFSLQSSASFGGSKFSTANSTIYVIDGNIVVVDISNSPHAGNIGDTITAYGKLAKMDMTDLPLFGGMIEEQAKSDPSLQGAMAMLFLVTKDVSKSAPVQPDTESDAPAGESEGWVN